MKLVVLVGSRRRNSFNRRLACHALELLPADVEAIVCDRIVDLPFYDEDLDQNATPDVATELRATVASADALLVVTPEYNGSLPGMVKNAIDWLSRPREDAPLAGMPTVVLAASVSPRAGLWAREDAVKVLGVAGAEVRDHYGIGTAYEQLDPVHLSEDHRRAIAAALGRLTLQPMAA